MNPEPHTQQTPVITDPGTSRRPASRSTARVAIMIGAAVAVTAIATAAVTATVTGDDSVFSPEDVDALLAAGSGGPTGPGTPTGTSTRTGTPTATGTTVASGQVVTLVPGIVTIACDGNVATLVSWSPNPGFRSDDPVRGPAAQVSVRFESDYDDDYKVTATCSGGVATVKAGPDDHHGGGDDDDHGSGGGPGSSHS